MNKKKITAMFTALTITAGAFFMPTVEAKMNTVEKIALGAAAVYFVSQYLAKMDNNQKGLIGEVQGKTGVDKDPEDNERVQKSTNPSEIQDISQETTKFMYARMKNLMLS